MKKYNILLAFLFLTSQHATAGEKPSAEAVLKGLQAFTKTTAVARRFVPPRRRSGLQGMSDSAYSNFAPVAYAVVIHRTFGWTLPTKKRRARWILNRQQEDGAFAHTAGTVDPKSAQGRVYNTTMALMALARARHKAEARPAARFSPR